MVGQVVEEFETSPRMVLVVAPEGTRKAAPYWKSGFARIATAAQVPIVPVVLDFPAKTLVVGDPIFYFGDEKALMDQLRVFFEPGVGKDGAGKGPVRLKEEDSV
jgi:1-acyl-sn-glycerol-3-phosphate acyltransferase